MSAIVGAIATWRSSLKAHKRDDQSKASTNKQDEVEWGEIGGQTNYFSLPSELISDPVAIAQDSRTRVKNLFERGSLCTTDRDRMQRMDESRSPARRFSFQKQLSENLQAATTGGEYPGSLWSTYQNELSESENRVDSDSDEDDRKTIPDIPYSDEDLLREFNLTTPFVDYSSQDGCVSVTGTIETSSWKKISELAKTHNVTKLRIDNNELRRDDARILQKMFEGENYSITDVTITNTQVGEHFSDPFSRVHISTTRNGGEHSIGEGTDDNRLRKDDEDDFAQNVDENDVFDPHAVLTRSHEGSEEARASRLLTHRLGDEGKKGCSRSMLDPSVRIWRRLLKAIRENNEITDVTLDNVNIDDRSKFYLFQFVSYAHGLKRFSLRNTEYSDGVALSQALFERDRPLDAMDLRGNPISGEHFSLLTWAASVDVTRSGGEISPERRELYHNLIDGQRGVGNALSSAVDDVLSFESSVREEPGSSSEPGSTSGSQLCPRLIFYRPEGWNDPSRSVSPPRVSNERDDDDGSGAVRWIAPRHPFGGALRSSGVNVREIARR